MSEYYLVIWIVEYIVEGWEDLCQCVCRNVFIFKACFSDRVVFIFFLFFSCNGTSSLRVYKLWICSTCENIKQRYFVLIKKCQIISSSRTQINIRQIAASHIHFKISNFLWLLKYFNNCLFFKLNNLHVFYIFLNLNNFLLIIDILHINLNINYHFTYPLFRNFAEFTFFKTICELLFFSMANK